MTQHFKTLLADAYNAGIASVGAIQDDPYTRPSGDWHDHIDSIAKSHTITIRRNSFDVCQTPLFAMTVFETMSNGTGHINNDLEIGWEFPIEISEEYVQNVLAKWGCSF